MSNMAAFTGFGRHVKRLSRFNLCFPKQFNATTTLIGRGVEFTCNVPAQQCYYSVSVNRERHRSRWTHGQFLVSAAIPGVRFNSSSSNKHTVEGGVDYIPAVPEIPEVITKSEDLIISPSNLIEPSFASQGLGGTTPIGLIQQAFEYFHVGLGIPWWGTIAIGTLIVRLCMFPLVIKAQQNAAKMNNHLPQMQMLQLKMTDARKTGDHLEAMKAAHDLQEFMKEKGINPIKQMFLPLCQAPVFISFFVALRRMANLPVQSMATGGLFWFTDLTISDPYYILPVVTSATMLLTIELGVDGIRADSTNTMKYVLRAMPIFILAFTIKFPTAILCYWMTSNVISLIQVLLLKPKPIREYLKIDPLIQHKTASLPISNKGFIDKIKENYSNQKIIKKMEDRQRFDEVRFRKAGLGPIQKTYPYDPTKQQSSRDKI